MSNFYILLRGRTDPNTFFYSMIAIIAIAIISWIFSRKAVVLRNLRLAKEKKIVNFTDGDKGKVIGNIVFAGETLTAPFSGRKCSFYHVIIEEYRSGGKHSYWYLLHEDEKKGDVVLHDGTGFAIVDTRFTMSYLVPDVKYESGRFSSEDVPMAITHYLTANNIDDTTFLGFSKTLRYFEGILEKDEICTVSGEGMWNLAKDHGLKISSQHVLVMTTEDAEREKVYLSDDPEAAENK